MALRDRIDHPDHGRGISSLGGFDPALDGSVLDAVAIADASERRCKTTERRARRIPVRRGLGQRRLDNGMMRFAKPEREIVDGAKVLVRGRETRGLGFDHREGALGDKC